MFALLRLREKEYENKGAAVTHTNTSEFPVTIIDIEKCAHKTNLKRRQQSMLIVNKNL